MARLGPLAALLALAFGLGACGGSAAAPEGGEAEAPLGPAQLVEALRGGGYVVYLRHAKTDPSHQDTQKTNVAACEGMRNLVAAGRAQARELGRALRALDVPVGDVRSSAYCRTRETAELAFDRYERDGVLTGFPDPGDPSYEERVRATRALLARRPPAGQNTVLVAHVKNLEGAADVTLAEGELVVFEPLGGEEFRYRGRIPTSAWPQLVERLARR